jgi:hypothetical protein
MLKKFSLGTFITDYHEQHYFLQRLPMISHVRSLYIPHIADHPHGANLKEQELAMQIVDIVTLRPEVELCYMGLARKCFEIIENKYLGHDNRVYPNSTAEGTSTNNNLNNGWTNIDGGEWTDEEDDVDLDDANSEDLGDVDDVESEATNDMDDDDSDDMSSYGGKRAPKLKLREILFYDDKVSIFKARHGHL